MIQNLKPYKGARDFYPEDKRLQKWMFDKWRRVVEKYGYQEYDSPIIEPTDLYLMKGSEEIVKEQTYTFKDRGDRSVTIRTEMTPSVSRMVAGRRQEIAYPARWYSIPNLWRYERMQRGRLREFWQLNIDIFGVSSEYAELEILQIVDDLFQEFKAKRSSYKIVVNSRVLVNTVLKNQAIDKKLSAEVVRLIDKQNKIDPSEFRKALGDIVGENVSKKLLKLLEVKKISELPKDYLGLESVLALSKILESLKSRGITNVEFDLGLMRGFDYYTDIVFEVFDNSPENNRSLFGGGRYDGLIGQFGVEPVPTVGFGMGDVTFMDFLDVNKLIPQLNPATDLIVLVRDQESITDAETVASELRENGINAAVDFSDRKIGKQLKAAIKSEIAYALFVGGDNKSETYTLKDLNTGNEENHSLIRIASIIKDTRK